MTTQHKDYRARALLAAAWVIVALLIGAFLGWIVQPDDSQAIVKQQLLAFLRSDQSNVAAPDWWTCTDYANSLYAAALDAGYAQDQVYPITVQLQDGTWHIFLAFVLLNTTYYIEPRYDAFMSPPEVGMPLCYNDFCWSEPVTRIVVPSDPLPAGMEAPNG